MKRITQEELSDLIMDNKDSMYRLAFSIVRNDADAQDAVSEAIVHAFDKMYQIRKISSAKSWLMKILVNASKRIVSQSHKFVLTENENQYEQIQPFESDEQIRAFAAKQKISTPKSYSNRVLLAISEGKNRKFPVRRIYLCRKAAIASICLCILMAGGVGVHAAIDYAQKRMEQISDKKKQHNLESLNGSMASADSFSRMLTEKEKK